MRLPLVMIVALFIVTVNCYCCSRYCCCCTVVIVVRYIAVPCYFVTCYLFITDCYGAFVMQVVVVVSVCDYACCCYCYCYAIVVVF